MLLLKYRIQTTGIRFRLFSVYPNINNVEKIEEWERNKKMSKSYKIKKCGNIQYITLERIDEGYQYDILKKVLKSNYYLEGKKRDKIKYNRYTFIDTVLVDGGIIENTKISYNDALKEVFKIYDIPSDARYIELNEIVRESKPFILLI